MRLFLGGIGSKIKIDKGVEAYRGDKILSQAPTTLLYKSHLIRKAPSYPQEHVHLIYDDGRGRDIRESERDRVTICNSISFKVLHSVLTPALSSSR